MKFINEAWKSKHHVFLMSENQKKFHGGTQRDTDLSEYQDMSVNVFFPSRHISITSD